MPDITVVRRDALYTDGNLAGTVILCVEILSPGQVFQDWVDKATRILRAGTPLCWIVWPERRQFWQCMPNNLSEVIDVLATHLSGIPVQVNLSDLWADLEE